MTRGEYLRARSAALSKKMVDLAVRIAESCYEDTRKYYVGCGKYSSLKSERDIVDAELQKLSGDSDEIAADAAQGGLGDLGDDDPPTTVKRRQPGNLRPNGSRPAEWGGR